MSLLKLFDNNINKYYLESLGFNNDVPVYRDFIHLHAKIFFSILDKYELEYYVFAGTSIGYVRNNQNIPWVDDYDIIVFKEDVPKFQNIIHILNDCGFSCLSPYKIGDKGGHHVLSKFGQKIFQCDIFYTIVKDNCLKNEANWGLYSNKKIPIEWVKPKQLLTIDGDLTLPFFNKINEDIVKEYGDIYNTCIIHIKHNPTHKINIRYEDVYKEFNDIKQHIIKNTLSLFKEYEYTNNMTLTDYNLFIDNLNEKDKFSIHIAFLKYVNEHNVKNLYIMDEQFLLFCVDVKYYFKDINIQFYMTKDINKMNLICLNYVDKILCSKQEYIDQLHKYDIVLIKNPVIDLIRVITFGTFDLFHIGHTNILQRAAEYGELYVGVSTCELNLNKGKISINNLEKRKIDVKNSTYAHYVFNEESLELKSSYVLEYNCNLLVMGDDWKDQFDFCNCACIYLPRTLDISTTILKENLITSN